MEPLISINTLSLEPASFDTHLQTVAAIGGGGIGATLEDIIGVGPVLARRMLDDSGITVATLTHRAFDFLHPAAGRSGLDATIAIAATIGAQTITMTTGGRGALPWTDAAARFSAEIAPCVAHARDAGTVLSLEPTSHLYADASLAHRLADTHALAAAAGMGVGIDLFACWSDADIEAAIAAAAPLTALVQVSDHVAGDRALPCRAVPGDGMVPVRRLLRLIRDAGYSGWFDLEIIGPRIAHDRVGELRRAVAYVHAALAEP